MKRFHLLLLAVTLVVPSAASAQPEEAIKGVQTQYATLDVAPGVQLQTMLTRPPGNNPLPAVVFVQWLSCDTVAVADRNDGWTQMLRGLIEQSGWVVARMDKRGVGESGGGPCAELDYNTELADHRAHLAAVKRHPWVDPERVVIFGGSMGGNFAPLVARGQRVAGVAAWGGGATTWYERQLGFERRALEFGATAAADINPRMSAIADFYAGYLLHGKSPADLRATKPEHNQAWGWMTGTSGDLHYGRPAAFHQQAQQQNWSAAWAQVQAPVFVAYGEFDWFESAAAHRVIADIVRPRHPVEFHIIGGMDHHFELYDSAQAAFDGTDGQADATPFLDLLLPWLTGLR